MAVQIMSQGMTLFISTGLKPLQLWLVNVKYPCVYLTTTNESGSDHTTNLIQFNQTLLKENVCIKCVDIHLFLENHLFQTLHIRNPLSESLYQHMTANSVLNSCPQ